VAIVVSDTSPVRALNHLGLLDLLRDLYGQVVVPPAVEQELLRPRRRFVAVPLRHLAYVQVRAPADVARVAELEKRLERGEAEAIALAWSFVRTECSSTRAPDVPLPPA
jgi:predicted nucleic acid-binding protein